MIILFFLTLNMRKNIFGRNGRKLFLGILVLGDLMRIGILNMK